MKARGLVFSTVVVLVFGVFAPVAGWAQSATDDERPVTQTEFATGLLGAILGQSRTSIDAAQAMTVLKDRGLVPAEWTGDEYVTMGETDEVFHQLGFRVEIHDSEELLLTQGVFELILRHHMGEIQRSRHHWDIVHYFSMGLELGEYRARIISPSGF